VESKDNSSYEYLLLASLFFSNYTRTQAAEDRECEKQGWGKK